MIQLSTREEVERTTRGRTTLSSRILGGLASSIGSGIISSLLDDPLEGAGEYARIAMADHSGILRNWLTEFFDVLTVDELNKPDPITGYVPDALINQLIKSLYLTAQLGMLIGSDIAEELVLELLQEGYSQAIQFSLGGALQTTMSVYRGGYPFTPDELSALFPLHKYFDDKFLSFFAAESGSNVPTLLGRIMTGYYTTLIEEHTELRTLITDNERRAIDNILRPYEVCLDYLATQINDMFASEIQQLEYAVSVLSEQAERGIARIQELIIELKTAIAHFDLGVISETDLLMVTSENLAEADVVLDSFEKLVQMFLPAIKPINSGKVQPTIRTYYSMLRRKNNIMNKIRKAVEQYKPEEDLQKWLLAHYNLLAYRASVNTAKGVLATDIVFPEPQLPDFPLPHLSVTSTNFDIQILSDITTELTESGISNLIILDAFIESVVEIQLIEATITTIELFATVSSIIETSVLGEGLAGLFVIITLLHPTVFVRQFVITSIVDLVVPLLVLSISISTAIGLVISLEVLISTVIESVILITKYRIGAIASPVVTISIGGWTRRVGSNTYTTELHTAIDELYVSVPSVIDSDYIRSSSLQPGQTDSYTCRLHKIATASSYVLQLRARGNVITVNSIQYYTTLKIFVNGTQVGIISALGTSFSNYSFPVSSSVIDDPNSTNVQLVAEALPADLNTTATRYADVSWLRLEADIPFI